jgi:RNA polymerase sigma factor (sigma-70 family)
MAVGPSRGVWKQVESVFRFGVSGHLGDAELLGRFVSGGRDEAAEAAFAALVERHGPMVLGVCRRVLGDRHAAEDAFQATFLVLARKAGAIARREQLANWLHGVASRTALDARYRDDRRRARERKASATAVLEAGPDDGPERLELRAILDEELARLPDAFRGPLILCELDGLSRQAAARRLGIPEGTLSSRLARAKDLLRDRLTRRGLAPSAVAIEGAARPAWSFLVPPSLAGSTIEAAARFAAGAPLAEAVSASVVTLTQGALHTMFLAKIKGVALAMAAAAIVTTGVGVLAQGPENGARRREREALKNGPGPASQEDRLGAVEEKLDRILEALGNTRRDVRRGVAGTTPLAGPAREGPIGPIDPPPPRPRGVRNPGSPREEPAGLIEPPPPQDLVRMRAAMDEAKLQALVRSRSIESRFDELERRLADLERRFGAMERRLSRADRAGAPDAAPATTPEANPGAGGPARR